MDDQPSTLRDGRYAVVRLLGEGAQAATFEAVDKKEGRPVAIKRFRVRGAKSWKEVELAEREARVLASIAHPGLPRYVEHFEDGGELFLVTELIEGESLLSLRKRGVVFSEADVVRFLRDVALVLDYLHGRAPPVVHRDIKPSNVLRRKDGSFALIDFGSVRDKMKPEGGSTVVGTFGFMAPEQFQGRAMPASDVYAAGATALAMLTGREPEDLPHKGLAIDVAASLGVGCSPALLRVLSSMLEPDPDRRASRLSPLLSGLGPAPEAREQKREQRREQRHEPKREERGRVRARSGIGKEFEDVVSRVIEEGVAHIEEELSRKERKSERKAQRKRERYERRAERAERRAERRTHAGRPPELPGLMVAFLLFGLTVAQIAVIVSLRAIVPAVLTMLSAFFGKGLREAASRTSEAGKLANDNILRAKDVVRGRAAPEGARIEVREVDRPAAQRRVRIADESDPDREAEEERLAEEEAEQSGRAKRRQGR
jgi:tRNA A-37 threonylcarbamoyl transferase component Bud32